MKKTVLGTYFEVRPQFEESITSLVSSLRKRIRAEKVKGKLICYLSIPLSATGGGYRPVNVEVSDKLKVSLESFYGAETFYVLAPGHVETELPPVSGVNPGGGEYMYMWTELLAGEDGMASDFDLVYFAGLSDFHKYFGIDGPNVLPKLGGWMADRGKTDPQFKSAILDNTAAKNAFLKYYAVKAGVSFSNGAHDEWNIFVKVNKKRITAVNGGVSSQIPCMFDGKSVSPLEQEGEVAPGYEKEPPTESDSKASGRTRPWVDPKEVY